MTRLVFESSTLRISSCLSLSSSLPMDTSSSSSSSSNSTCLSAIYLLSSSSSVTRLLELKGYLFIYLFRARGTGRDFVKSRRKECSIEGLAVGMLEMHPFCTHSLLAFGPNDSDKEVKLNSTFDAKCFESPGKEAARKASSNHSTQHCHQSN